MNLRAIQYPVTMWRQTVTATFLSLAACATPTTGVVPTGEGAYVVTRQGSGAWVTTADLRVAATREAQDYCRGQGKAMKLIHAKEVQARPFGGWPEAEVIFNCM